MTPQAVSMPALLLVDSRERVREDLAAIVRAEFAEVDVLETGKGEDLITMMDQALSRGLDLIAAVVDVRTLVGGEGWSGPDLALRDRLWEARTWALGNSPVILFLSSHPDDPVVHRLRDEAAERMTRTVDVPRQVFLQSIAPGWDEALLNELRKVVHPRRIAARMARLAMLAQPANPGGPATLGIGPAPTQHSPSSIDPTQLIAELLRDMQRQCAYIRSDLRDEVARLVDSLRRPARPGPGGRWP